jgi:hypothetical protein
MPFGRPRRSRSRFALREIAEILAVGGEDVESAQLDFVILHHAAHRAE